jgi:hypothetical protein
MIAATSATAAISLIYCWYENNNLCAFAASCENRAQKNRIEKLPPAGPISRRTPVHTINLATSLILKTVTLICLAVAWPGNAVAQERQRIFFSASQENSKFTQRYAIDLPDMRGHQVRVYEIRRTFPTNPPIVKAVAIQEIWTRGMADYTDYSGHGTLYSEYVLENGDRFFSVASFVAHRTGLDEFLSHTSGYITYGTGMLVGIEGVVRTTAKTHPKAGTLEVDTELQYSVGGSDSRK